MAKFCSECGAKLLDHAVFCNICGTHCSVAPQPAAPQPVAAQPAGPAEPRTESPMNTPSAPAPAKKKSVKLLVILLAAAAAVIIAGVVLLIVFNPFGGSSDTQQPDGAAADPSAVSTDAADATTVVDPDDTSDSPDGVMSKLAARAMERIDEGEFLPIVFEYQFAVESMRQTVYDTIHDQEPDYRAQREKYGRNYEVKITISDKRTLTDDEKAKCIDVLDDYAVTSNVEEITLISGTMQYNGKIQETITFDNIFLVKAEGHWYVSIYLKRDAIA